MKDLGYAAYFHPAPIFDQDNFFGNRDNHWAPKSIVSMMVLAVPEEKRVAVEGLTRISSAQQWWDT